MPLVWVVAGSQGTRTDAVDRGLDDGSALGRRRDLRGALHGFWSTLTFRLRSVRHWRGAPPPRQHGLRPRGRARSASVSARSTAPSRGRSAATSDKRQEWDTHLHPPPGGCLPRSSLGSVSRRGSSVACNRERQRRQTGGDGAAGGLVVTTGALCGPGAPSPPSPIVVPSAMDEARQGACAIKTGSLSAHAGQCPGPPCESGGSPPVLMTVPLTTLYAVPDRNVGTGPGIVIWPVCPCCRTDRSQR